MPSVRLQIPDDLWTEYRSLCVLRKKKVSEVIEELLAAWVDKERRDDPHHASQREARRGGRKK